MIFRSHYSLRKERKVVVLIISILFILIFTILNNPSNFFANSNEENQTYNNLNDFRNPKTSSNGPNSKPLLIYQHATISTTKILPQSLPTNVSFTLLEGWTSKNVTIHYDGVSHYKDWVINGSFDTGEIPWEYHFSSDDIDKKAWAGGYIGIDVDNNKNVLKGQSGYFEENFTLPETLASEKIVYLSMDYKFDDLTPNTDICAFISISFGGDEKNFTRSFSDLVKGSWTTWREPYDISVASQELPDNATIRAGVYVNISCTTEPQVQTLLIDNIEFEVWTNPNQSNLIIAEDIEFSLEYPYQNITYGEGETIIDVERSRTETSEIKFTISKNDTFTEELKIYNITITSEAVKILNSTIDLQDGSLYTPNANINWQTEGFIDILPYTYLNNWAEINKPSDWNITSVLDGYNSEKRANCTGTELGSEKLIIPEEVFSSGLWTLEASSQSYISKGIIEVWNGTFYNEELSITFGDKFQINATLNNTIAYENTYVNCTIEYPNGTLYLNDSKKLSSYNVKFGDFTVGNNMSVGSYKVMLLWTNNQSYLSRDKVGYLEFYFNVWHHTNLTAVDSYLEKVSGEPFLLKVNFTDYDSNIYIDFATISYNSTFPGGTSGPMAYLGSGIYVADVDTSGLDIGSYYFSFNASKNHYENQSISDLIQLKIIVQPLALEVPKTVINANGNSYAICGVNVTGALSGTLIPSGNNTYITTDWHKPFTVIDHDNGTYTLSLSTDKVPTQGSLETFTVTVFANKTNYGSTSAFITLTVHPISTIVNVSESIIYVPINDTVEIEAFYIQEGSGILINEAICSVTWPNSYRVISQAQGFVIRLNTSTLSIDTYTAILKLEKAGYETYYKSITIIVEKRNIEVNTIGFQDSIQGNAGERVKIALNLTEEGLGTPIENANITYSWIFNLGELQHIGNGTYETNLNIPDSADGSYTMTLTISIEGGVYKTRDFSFVIVASQEPTPNYMIWVIIGALLCVSGVFGALILRSYVMIPRKRKKEQLFMNTIQVFKDVRNIHGIILIQKNSGLPIFMKNVSGFDFEDNTLVSGFIQAITIFGEQVIKDKVHGDKKVKHKEIYSEHIIELNFKYFHLLICDYGPLKSILILKDKSSKKLKMQLYLFTVEIDKRFSKKIENFVGKSIDFEDELEALLKEFLYLQYNEPFKLIRDKTYVQFLKKSRELPSTESRILNVIISLTKLNKEFTLNRILEEIDEKNIDLLYGGLHTLIKRRIIVPTYFKDEDSHPLIGGLKKQSSFAKSDQ